MPPGDPQPPYELSGTFIVLTIEDANQVRMLTTLGHACAPVPLLDSTLILPVELLSDPYHAAHHDFLAALPQRADVMSDELADGTLYPDEFRACTYNAETWQEGEPVVVELPPGGFGRDGAAH